MAAALAPERWRRLRPLLDQALDLDTQARAQFLSELSTAHDGLRADLERLIRRHEQTAGVDQPAAALAGAALEQTDPTPLPHVAPFVGRRVGPFQLTRLLGAGGMGAVYEGQRVEGGFRQTVAIKLVAGIHPGLTARFERERQILADLRHPCIAQLLDGGETSDGMPYFALEYVDGQPITAYADAIGADVPARIHLLIEVAEALAYAHRRHVIHRDIKPNNILVSQDGHVKLLDFGIAKLFKGESGPSLTRQHMGPMTPEYAAPEQFRGGELGPATDVYQFGVLMFRLLSGRMPYRASASDGLAWARAVSEDEPLSLSTALREARRAAPANVQSGEITLKRPLLPRASQLDAIIRRALAKTPGARYPSLDALIADLQAYLNPPARRWPAGAGRALALAALLAATAVSAPWWWPLLQGGANFSLRDWQTDPALAALGIYPENIYAEHADTQNALRQALQMEARGDAPAALVLLEGIHLSDRRTPIPALLLSYWSGGLGRLEDVKRWRVEAAARLSGLDDAYLHTLERFLNADIDGSPEDALRYSAALLEMHPRAWFLHLARAHALNGRGLRVAALAELQAIDVTHLGHRKLVDAIADRASLGDLAGAQAQFAHLNVDPNDAQISFLSARLRYTAGDLVGARDDYLQAIELARRSARFDIEARALLWAGIYSGALGDYVRAAPLLRNAKTRLSERSQYAYAADAALALAQIAALAGDAEASRAEVQTARDLIAQVSRQGSPALLDLMAARLTGERIAIDTADAGDTQASRQLRLARRSLQEGDGDGARRALERARAEGAGDDELAEEAAMLARELGAPEFALGAIDPPFGPYARYAARWALGAGASIAPSKLQALP